MEGCLLSLFGSLIQMVAELLARACPDWRWFAFYVVVIAGVALLFTVR
jgi:hypothetical protein